MHPTLLIGPADWDAARFPRVEFAARIAALWRVCDRDVAGAVVFGNPRHHAELAWLTHFSPKLESCLALIGRHGPPRLFIGGGVNMLDAARPLTWIDELLPLRGAAKAIGDWGRELGETASLALIGGDAMPFGLRRDIAPTLGAAIDITPRLVPLMARKSGHELMAIRDACATLDAAIKALEAAWRTGAAVTAAILAAELAASRTGAQEVRTLFSFDGGRTLVPFTVPDTRRSDPLQVYVAVRRHGYWAEGFATFAASPSRARHAAGAALRAGIAATRAGVTRRAVALAMRPAHPAVAQAPVAAVGPSLEETAGADDEMLAPGSVYSLRAGILDGPEAAIVSAMVAIMLGSAEILWMQT
jgi:Xaa-Pro aminopeptidase